MKKYINIFVAIVTAIVLVTLPGCKKALDFVDSKFCRIDKFIFKDQDFHAGFDTMQITYNSSGNPIIAIRTNASTGSPNVFFKYDVHNRLTDLISDVVTTLPSEGIVESWQKYFYDTHNRIVKDSFYAFPTVINGMPDTVPHGTVYIITYEYDSKNRVIKAITDFGTSSITETFAYDGAGNLVGTPHDDKVNFHRTNKIWMFLDKDYSVNNPATATYTYNQNDLPKNIVPYAGTAGSFMSLSYTSIRYTEADIQYNCP